MPNPPASLREMIAQEAARLLLRGKVSDFSAAKKKASRWLSKRRVKADDMPDSAEIQWQIDALAGRSDAECLTSGWFEISRDLREVCHCLDGFQPSIWRVSTLHSTSVGMQMFVRCVGDVREVELKLAESAIRCDSLAVHQIGPEFERHLGCVGENTFRRLRFNVPIVLQILQQEPTDSSPTNAEFVSINEFEETLFGPIDVAPVARDADEISADNLDYLRFLMERLEGVSVSADFHPEGDLLYHSLQAFELGAELHPYDEEFQWACLLHDVGYVMDRHQPQEAALGIIEDAVGERVARLVSALPFGIEYLQRGRFPKLWASDPDAEFVRDLARCDRDGRQPGMNVRELDEVFNALLDGGELEY